jgi:hypothetical protein
MSADVINLRRARKHKARADKDQQAAENRVRHGRTKAEKLALRREADLQRTRHEGHRRPDAPSTTRDDV